MRPGKDALLYIQLNWLKQTDEEMGKALHLKLSTVYNYRYLLHLSRINKQPLDKKLVALVLEHYVNRTPIKSIGALVNKSSYQIGQILSAHYFGKRRSYDTITLVLDSKINYD